MKHIIRSLAILLILLPLIGFAGKGSSFMGSVTVPVQEFQSANSHSSGHTQPASVSAKSNKSSAPTKESVAREALASQSASSQSSAKRVSHSPSNAPLNQVRSLQAQLNQVNRNTLAFQQKTDEEILRLKSENQNLQNRLERMAQAMILLNREVSQLTSGSNLVTQHHPAQRTGQVSVKRTSIWSHLESHFGPVGFKIAVIGIGVILVLLIWLIWPSRKKKENTNEIIEDAQTGDVLNDTEGEYDYMGSKESIPAKLNLVRTYIAMEDFESARKVLKEVLKFGDKKQQQEATEMLEELPAES